MLSSLRSRLILSYILVIFLCLALAGLALVLLLRGYQTRVILVSLVDRAIPTARRVHDFLKRGIPPEQIGELLREQAEAQRMRIMLLSASGQVLADTEDELKGQTLDLSSRKWGQALRGEYTTPDGERLFFVAVPIASLRSPPGSGVRPLLVVLAVPRRSMAPLLSDLTSTLLWAGLVALALSIPIALFIAHSIAQPLQRIAQAAESIAKGDYEQELAITSPSEVGSLAASFNRMVREVRASRQAQRDFLANVSHELKTPLTSIQGFSQAILDGTAADEEARRQAASIIYEEAERMGKLVEDLLELARIESGQVPMTMEPLDLARLLRKTWRRFGERARSKGIELTAEIPSLPPIQGDARRLEQVFSNLLDNALKYTPSGGKVRLEARPTQAPSGSPAVEISVTDTGPGIPPEDLPRVFERFYQVDKSRSRKGRGVGLGLAIAKEIVEAHRGHIRAESVVGLGSRFVVTLPVSEGEEATTRDPSQAGR